MSEITATVGGVERKLRLGFEKDAGAAPENKALGGAPENKSAASRLEAFARDMRTNFRPMVVATVLDDAKCGGPIVRMTLGLA